MNVRVSKAVVDPRKHWNVYICMIFAAVDTSWKYNVLSSNTSNVSDDTQ